MPKVYKQCLNIIQNDTHLDWSQACTIKPVLRGHLWEKIHMKYSMMGQEKNDLLIQVTTSAGLTVFRET